MPLPRMKNVLPVSEGVYELALVKGGPDQRFVPLAAHVQLASLKIKEREIAIATI